jgi:hypothetical protein
MLGSEDELGQGVPDAAESEESIPVAEPSDNIGGPDTDGTLSVADGLAAIRESIGIPANIGPDEFREPLSDGPGIVVPAVGDGMSVGEEPVAVPESAERVVVIEPAIGPVAELVGDTVKVYADAEQRTRQGWPNTYGYDPDLWP